MIWNEVPFNSNRIRNNNTWIHTNKVQADHIIGSNEGKNVYINVNNIGNKSSTLLKSKNSKFEEINTSICKNEFRDNTRKIKQKKHINRKKK